MHRHEYWCEIDKFPIYVQIHGIGQPIVMVHGHGSSHQMWSQLITSNLAEYFQCITFDLPGHGLSGKPQTNWYSLENFSRALVSICQQLNIHNHFLIGHSLGAMICINTVRELQSKKLILISPPVQGSFLKYLDPLMRLEKIVENRWVDRLYDVYLSKAAFSYPVGIKTFHEVNMVHSASFHRIYHELGMCTPSSLYGSYIAIRKADVSALLSSITIPTLIIAGGQDRVVPNQQARVASKLLPQARLLLVENCGHLPTDENPEIVFSAIDSFLEE